MARGSGGVGGVRVGSERFGAFRERFGEVGKVRNGSGGVRVGMGRGSGAVGTVREGFGEVGKVRKVSEGFGWGQKSSEGGGGRKGSERFGRGSGGVGAFREGLEKFGGAPRDSGGGGSGGTSGIFGAVRKRSGRSGSSGLWGMCGTSPVGRAVYGADYGAANHWGGLVKPLHAGGADPYAIAVSRAVTQKVTRERAGNETP